MSQFVLTNFASTSLTEGLAPEDTELLFEVADTPLFPALGINVKFPIVLSEPTGSNFPEIVYATAITDGVMTIERGQEGTLPQYWLAGTKANHTLTAASVAAVVGLNPRGVYDEAELYAPRDVVNYLGVSYIAVVESSGSTPAADNANWQSVYMPVGADADTVSWAGRWNIATPYVAGNLVEHAGRLWIALTEHTGQEPEAGNVNWRDLMPWTRVGQYNKILTAAGLNNYTVVADAADIPTERFDGMTVYVRFPANNTSTTPTLKIGSLPATMIRAAVGGTYPIGGLRPGQIHQLIYVASDNSFIEPCMGNAVKASGETRAISLGGALSVTAAVTFSGFTTINANLDLFGNLVARSAVQFTALPAYGGPEPANLIADGTGIVTKIP